METPVISVICPIYNMEVSLTTCITSILNQTFKDFELILIDDGSTDGSGKICDRFAATDNRVRAIHKLNAGVSAARQAGIELARGKYTIHVDPDDWIAPDMLENLYEKAAEEDADMVIADYYVNTETQETYEIQKPTALDPITVLHDLFYGLHGNCWNKLIRRECYSDYGIKFPADISFREDFCVIVQLLLHPVKIAYLNRAFYHYVRNSNPNSITEAVNPKKLHDQLVVIDHVRSYLNGAFPECLNILKADVACWLIESGFKTAHEVRHDFRDLLSLETFLKLPGNRRVKILLSFFFGKSATVWIHDRVSRIKTAIRSTCCKRI